jgi:mono/diheme cytochrome c family protein
VGQGGAAIRLAPNPVSRASFIAYVRNGKRNSGASPFWSGMPAYSNKFISDSELADLYAYVASIPAPPSPTGIPALSE